MASYSTTFPVAQNPIDTGLITSTSPGVNWSGLGLGGSGTLPVAPVDVAYPGEAESVYYNNSNYGDALAVATGTWSPDQSASVVVGNIAAQPGGYEEIEIHLRTDPITGAGYEITWGYNHDYILVATWNAHGGYTYLYFADTSTAIHPGDTLTASIKGNVITMYDNGVQEAQITDNTFTSGNPGFGFNEGGTAEYGISSFSASDSGTSPPPPPSPTISSIVESPASGDLNAGKTVTLTLNLSGAVTVSGGTPTLTLNDGGTATYTGGSGTSALTFSYTVGAGQNTAGLAATAVNLNSATIKDGAGNAANLSLTGLTQTGPQIDTTAPAPPVITNDTFHRNHTVTLTGTAEPYSTVTVYDNGSTRLGTTTASTSGAWTYTTRRLPKGTNLFTATATDAAGNTSALSNAIDPVIGPSKISSFTVSNGAIVDLNGQSAAPVTFTGTNGTLRLDQPSTFTGTVSGFGAQNAIDLPEIAFDAQTTLGYSPNSKGPGGTLSITDGNLSAKIALLGNYMASSFAMASDNNGGTLVVAEAMGSGNQSLLTNPKHA